MYCRFEIILQKFTKCIVITNMNLKRSNKYKLSITFLIKFLHRLLQNILATRPMHSSEGEGE